MEFLNVPHFKHHNVELFDDEGQAFFNERFYIQLNEADRSAYLDWLYKQNKAVNDEKEGFFSKLFNLI